MTRTGLHGMYGSRTGPKAESAVQSASIGSNPARLAHPIDVVADLMRDRGGATRYASYV